MGKKVWSIRMIGRNPINPYSRKKGIVFQQRLEVNNDGSICNTLPTVAKDNWVLEYYGITGYIKDRT